MEAAILQAVDNTKRYETEICALQDKVIPEYISIRSVTFFFRSYIHLFCVSWTHVSIDFQDMINQCATNLLMTMMVIELTH